jgi:hypothetical protein
MSKSARSFPFVVAVLACVAPALIAGCAEINPGERGPNSAQDAHGSTPVRVDRPATPHAR